jgi:hypothetical protein
MTASGTVLSEATLHSLAALLKTTFAQLSPDIAALVLVTTEKEFACFSNGKLTPWEVAELLEAAAARAAALAGAARGH